MFVVCAVLETAVAFSLGSYETCGKYVTQVSMWTFQGEGRREGETEREREGG